MARILPFRYAKEDDRCRICQRTFREHFKPPPEADWDITAHWCPNLLGGFTSDHFVRKITRKQE